MLRHSMAALMGGNAPPVHGPHQSLGPTGAPLTLGPGPAHPPGGHPPAARSRSPPRFASAMPGPLVRPSWLTGDAMLDNYMQQHLLHPSLHDALSRCSLTKVQSWVLSCMQKQINKPEPWIWACVKKDGLQQQYRDVAQSLGHPAPASGPFAARGAAPGDTVAAAPAPLHAAPPHAEVTQPFPPPPAAPRVEMVAPRATTPPPSQASGTSLRPPFWVREAVALATRDKRAFLRSFVSKLSPPVQGLFYGIPMESQVFAAWSILHMPKAWSDPDLAVRSMISVMATMFPAVISAVGPGTAGQELFFKPVFHCAGGGTGLIALHCALIILGQLRPDVSLRLLVGWSSETWKEAQELEHELGNRLKRETHCIGDARSWPRLVRENSDAWKSEDFTLLSITTAPCTCISRANTGLNALKGQGDEGLHTAPTNVIHACYEGDAAVVDSLGPDRFASFMEFPECAQPGEERAVTEMYGEPVNLLSHERYALAKRSRNVRTSPNILSCPVARRFGPCDNTAEVNGWKWKGNPTGDSSYNATVLRKYLPTLLERKLSGEPLSASEENSLLGLRMVHGETGEERYVGREWWLRWLGHEPDTPFEDLLNQQFPCHGWIYPCTGMAAPAKSHGAQVCGQTVYCENCSLVMGIISNGFDVKSMTDAMVEWLLKVIASRVDKATVNTYLPRRDLVHQCGDSCPKGVRQCCDGAVGGG